MSKVNVVIVDSGVKKNHAKFTDDTIIGFTYKDGRVINEINDTYGHGTAIYNIIRKIDNAEITNIKIDKIEEGVSCEEIISALTYVYNNIDADIINLSLGLSVCEDYKKLYDICEKLTKKGVIIVSAFDNAGSISYPAAFDNVIGVTTGDGCNKISDYEFIDDEVINIAAYGSIQRLAWIGPDYIFLGGNSFACAHVTVEIAKLMNKGIMDRNDILNELKANSVRQHKRLEYNKDKKLPYKIKKAAIFPFNKEIHSLVRYSDELDFEIAAIYDSKYSGRVGVTTNNLLKCDLSKNITIENIEKIDWNLFDTLIIGHINELSALINNEELRTNLIKKALELGKNIYCFDNILETVPEEKRKNIYCPSVYKEDLPPLRYGKLYRIAKPVLGVFGTSSKQGKFTLQLQLRKIFKKKGFSIGQLGTEPTSLLYGMDHVYPMGYNSSVYIKEFDAVRYLNYLMNDIAMKDNDIIIVGSQSGTVTYDNGNIALFNISQYNFLMGTQPDTIVLCINPYDDFEYIDRTIKFIESSVDCKVIGFVIFPMNLETNWKGIYGKKRVVTDDEVEVLKRKLYDKFKINAYLLGTNQIEELVDDIIKYYSE